MGLKINNIFIDSEEKIREGIAKFNALNCRSNYIGYLDSETDDEFERKYILRLNDNLEDLCIDLYKESINNLTEEGLREQLICNEGNGVYGVYDRDNESLCEYVENILTDKEAYDIIKSHMEQTLDSMIKEANKTKLDKEIEAKENELSSVIRSMASYQNLCDKQAKLQEELKVLKSKK